MQIFITGTDTNVGKTVVSSWLCLQAGYDYFKPIQSGVCEGRDSLLVADYSGAVVYPETYSYSAPLSPHLAAAAEGEVIDTQRIQLPPSNHLIVEGAGGVLVPINADTLMVDLIEQLQLPVVLVVASRLGMINHSLLSLEALRSRNVSVLGVIVTGEPQEEWNRSIEEYGHTEVLAQIPFLPDVNKASLSRIQMGAKLASMMRESI